MRKLALTLSGLAAFAAPTIAQSSSGISFDARPKPLAVSHQARVKTYVSGSTLCHLVDFEGVGNQVPVGQMPGVIDVTFGPAWLGLVDSDAGGSGNFANEPSPDTIAFFTGPPEPIEFSAPVSFVEISYVAGSSSIPFTMTAWDGPGGTGNVVGTADATTVGNSGDGANCTGDPGGSFCLFDTISVSSSSDNILSITVDATPSQCGFDDLRFCTQPAVQPYCTSKTNSCGTLPQIGWSGVPSASASSGFEISLDNAKAPTPGQNPKAGVLLYSVSGGTPVPFDGGWLCVDGPRRTANFPPSTTGTPGQCDARHTLDFNAYARNLVPGQTSPDPALSVLGTDVWTQWFARDTVANGRVQSDALFFAMGI